MKPLNRKSSDHYLRVELLESRYLLTGVPPQIAFLDSNLMPLNVDPSDYLSGSAAAQSALLPELNADIAMFLTTTDNSANHVTPSGVGFDGVVELRLYPNLNDLNSYVLCTATLLPTGHELLTAAHCFTSVAIQGANAVFHMPTGDFFIPIDQAVIGPGWNGNFLTTADIAVAHLLNAAPDGAERFDIYRGANELNADFETVGYGRSGTGLQGDVLPAGAKRDGQNHVDAFGQALNGTVYPAGTVIADGHLVFDFDNGAAANDASGFFLGVNNLGLGNLEVGTAPGDSGGPALIDGRIAGVTSFGIGFNGFTDILAGTNSSFGEFCVDTRVSHYAAWIDTVVDIVAPRITDVLLSGSAWGTTPGRDPISFRDDEYLGVTLTGSGSQLKPIPVEGIDRIQVEFSENVTGLGVNSLQLISAGSRAPNFVEIEPLSYSFDEVTHVATWNLNRALDSGRYAILLNQDGTIADSSGNVLDGDWNNPDSPADNVSSTFASGDGIAGGEFRSNFSVLPGDYNRDFVVNSGDYTVWLDTYLTPGSPLYADGNGDGALTTADYQVQQSHFGESVPLVLAGDYTSVNNSLWIVDQEDYLVWKNTFGMTVPVGTGADGNGNGIIDIGDYAIWNEHFGTRDPWKFVPPVPGLASVVVDLDGAPQVTGLVVRGSQSTHSDYDFALVDGSGEQLKTVPIGGLDTVSVSFSEEVFVDSDDLTLLRLQGQSVPSLADFSYDVESCTATWVFEAPLPSGQYLIRLSDDVHDLDMELLDGEFENPWALADAAGTSDTFPSGDGVAGGEFRFRFTNLLGDASRDNIVDGTDNTILSTHWLGGPGKTFTQADFTGDGYVTTADFGVFAGTYLLNYTVWPSYEPGLIRVSTLADELDTDYSFGDLSLREALVIAASQAGPDTIVFADSLFSGGMGTITLGSAGRLEMGDEVTIQGPGANLLAISGGGLTGVISVPNGVTAEIDGVTIRDGNAGAGYGAGVSNSGDLTLDSVVVTENTTTAHGGGIYNNNTIRIINSTISENSADVGGGFSSHTDVSLGVVIENSAIIDNDANYAGGAFFHRYNPSVTTGTARITNSTVSGNDATGNGGGIMLVGGFNLTIVNSTITDNAAGVGTGVGQGGGIWNSGSPITLHNSILAGNSAPTPYWSDFWGTTVQPSYNNLIGINGSTGLTDGVDGNQVGNQTTPLNPGLAPLGDYGGPTKTHALLSSSPAIDAGDNSVAIAYELDTDQRGFDRIADWDNDLDARVDIGAVELAFGEIYS